MKIIFLDIDGVLNTHKTIHTFGRDFIDDALVAVVAKIVNETQAKIVLSSTWRLDAQDKLLVEQALACRDLSIHDCTPQIQTPGSWTERRIEIQAWLDNNQHTTRFAILDDWPDASIDGSFFHVDENLGLTVSIAEQVIEHLGRS